MYQIRKVHTVEIKRKGGTRLHCRGLNEIYTHSELLRTSRVRRAVGVNKSVNRGLPGSQGELGSKGTVSGRVKAVVGSVHPREAKEIYIL